MNSTEKLSELSIFFNLIIKSSYNSGSESPWRKTDLSKLGCKDQESIQSSTIPDPGYQWESGKFTV